MEFRASRKVRDRETRSPARETRALPRKCAQVVGHIWEFPCQRFDIADFDVDFLYAEHSGLKIERRTSTVQHRKDSRAGIESAHGHRT